MFELVAFAVHTTAAAEVANGTVNGFIDDALARVLINETLALQAIAVAYFGVCVDNNLFSYFSP